jgi:hypothetical protein
MPSALGIRLADGQEEFLRNVQAGRAWESRMAGSMCKSFTAGVFDPRVDTRTAPTMITALYRRGLITLGRSVRLPDGRGYRLWALTQRAKDWLSEVDRSRLNRVQRSSEGKAE